MIFSNLNFFFLFKSNSLDFYGRAVHEVEGCSVPEKTDKDAEVSLEVSAGSVTFPAAKGLSFQDLRLSIFRNETIRRK